ncbi:hypothetical protein [Veronia nyctiphanis]|uniref:hypothetical protein n=1 Tax=Veronia nyctiphanis TaxID=1278244 RepID=UPI001375D707|nr:hypothetical protein [Veronia nyctiphanis]
MKKEISIAQSDEITGGRLIPLLPVDVLIAFGFIEPAQQVTTTWPLPICPWPYRPSRG